MLPKALKQIDFDFDVNRIKPSKQRACSKQKGKREQSRKLPLKRKARKNFMPNRFYENLRKRKLLALYKKLLSFLETYRTWDDNWLSYYEKNPKNLQTKFLKQRIFRIAQTYINGFLKYTFNDIKYILNVMFES